MSTTQETTTTPATSNLLDEVAELNAEYERNPEEMLARSRVKSTEEAMTALLTSEEARSRFASGVRARASEGKMTYRLVLPNGRTSWSFRENVRFNNRYLLDLLNKGDLLTTLQNHLDTHYQTETRRFRIFPHKLKNSRNEFALTVSWNQEKFSDIDEIITHNREVTEQRRQERESRMVEGGNDEEGDDGETREERRPRRDGGNFRPRRRDGDNRHDGGNFRPRRNTRFNSRRDGGDDRRPRRDGAGRGGPSRRGRRDFSNFSTRQQHHSDDE